VGTFSCWARCWLRRNAQHWENNNVQGMFGSAPLGRWMFDVGCSSDQHMAHPGREHANEVAQTVTEQGKHNGNRYEVLSMVAGGHRS
jgi:hypothetical protein